MAADHSRAKLAELEATVVFFKNQNSRFLVDLMPQDEMADMPVHQARLIALHFSFVSAFSMLTSCTCLSTCAAQV